MTSSIGTLGHCLSGKTIFLSASVPAPERDDRFRRVENAHFEIDQAVISLARAVFSEGGRLVFGGHPAISPLVAMVAGEYRQPAYAETGEERPAPLIRIFQSRAFEGFLPDDTLMMYRTGYAAITWTEAIGDERFDPGAHYTGPPCPRSLAAMREAMIEGTQPVAMVCVGGMEGVEQEFEVFRKLRPGIPVYVLEGTGGAAGLLAERDRDRVRVIDAEIAHTLRRLRADFPAAPRGERPADEPAPPATPYPLIMQTLVSELAGPDSHGMAGM